MNISRIRLVLSAAIAAALGFAASAETLAIGRAISVAAVSCDESGELKFVDLALEPGVPGMSDELYFAYGTTDGGPSLDGWEHTVKVATFDEATNTSCRVTNLPAGYGTAYVPFRFILVAKTLSAGYYRRRDKLVAHFDAIENKAFGAHNATIATWNDLTGKRTTTQTGTPSIGEKGISFTWNTDQYYAVQNVSQLCSDMGKVWTVETAVTPTADWAHLSSGICGCHDNGGRGVTMGQVWNEDKVSQTGKFNASFFVSGQLNNKSPTNQATGTFTNVLAHVGELLTFSLLDSTTNFSFYVDGARSSGGTHTDPTDSSLSIDKFFLGRGWTDKNRNFSGQIHSIRVYNCNLTDEEIAVNRKLDEARFGTADVVVVSSTPDEGSVWRVTIERIPAQILPQSGRSEPEVVVWNVKGSTRQRIPATDYEVVYANNDKVGVATVTVTVTGQDPVSREFAIGTEEVPSEEDFSVGDSGIYDKDSLFAQFDAIDNAGVGQHSDSTTTWVNLKNSSYNGAYQLATAPAWTANGVALTYNTKQYFTISGNFLSRLGARWTVELLVTAGEDYGKDYSGIFGNHGVNGKMGLVFGQSGSAGNCSFNTYQPGLTPSGSTPGSGIAVSRIKDGKPHLISLVLSTDDRRLYLDGELVSQDATVVSANLVSPNLDPCYIGRAYADDGRNFSGVIHAVRVYTDLLSAEEVAHNRLIDGARFFGWKLEIVGAKKSGSTLQLTLRRTEATVDASVACHWGSLYHGADAAAWEVDGGIETSMSSFGAGSTEIVVTQEIPAGMRFLRFRSGAVWAPTLDLTTVEEEEIVITPPELGELTTKRTTPISAIVDFTLASVGSGATSCDIFAVVSRDGRPAETNQVFASTVAGTKSFPLALPNASADYVVSVFAINDATNAVVSTLPATVDPMGEKCGSGIALLCPTNGLYAYYDAVLPHGVNGSSDPKAFLDLTGRSWTFIYTAKDQNALPKWTENGVELTHASDVRFQCMDTRFEEAVGSHGVWTIQACFTPSANCYVDDEHPGVFGGHVGSDGIVFGQLNGGNFYFGAGGAGGSVPMADLPPNVRTVVTLTGSPTQYVLYKDNQQYGDVITPSANASTIPNPQNCAIGSAWVNGGRTWNGYIDYVRIYTNVLSAAELTNLYQLDLIRQGKKTALDFKRLVYTGHGVRGKVSLAFGTDRSLDLWVVCGPEYANRDIAQWPYHRKVATFDPTAKNKTVPFAADGFPRNIDIRYVRFVLLPAGTAEERLTDLGAWCQSYYVPDMPYQPDGLILFVR